LRRAILVRQPALSRAEAPCLVQGRLVSSSRTVLWLMKLHFIFYMNLNAWTASLFTTQRAPWPLPGHPRSGAFAGPLWT